MITNEGEWRRRREQMRRDTVELVDHPQDLAEAAAIQADLEPYRVW